MGERRALMVVPYERLIEALYLPEGTKIITVIRGTRSGEFLVLLEHEDLEEVGWGDIFPNVEPVFEYHLIQKQPRFKGWGSV